MLTILAEDLESFDNTLPKQRRLLRPAEYRLVFAKNTSVSDRHFIVLSRPNALNHARLGMAVAKKHLKRAVDRNTAKRVIRESFRHQQWQLGNLDVVVLVKRGIPVHNARALHGALDTLWQKLIDKCAQSSHS